LDSQDVFTEKLYPETFPIDQISSFVRLKELFVDYHSVYFPTMKLERKLKFEKLYTRIVFTLWLSGYSLFPDEFCKQINNQVLLQHLLDRKDSLFRSAIRFLSFILFNENLATEMIGMKELETKFNLEKTNWRNVLDQNDTEIARELYNYVFNSLRDRVSGSLIVNRISEAGESVQIGLSRITEGTWRGASQKLRQAAIELKGLGVETVEEFIENGYAKLIHKVSFEDGCSQFTVYQYRSFLGEFLQDYSGRKGLPINLLRIFPRIKGRGLVRHGKILNLSAASQLINELLDEHSDKIRENHLGEFKFRRFVLIMLETGARRHEVAVLKRDCIVTINGKQYIHFHKTKTGKERYTLASPDLIRWVKDLQHFSPKNKIFLNKQQYAWGDNESHFRLIGNLRNNGPFPVNSLNKFLKKLQEKIWSKDSHPNGIPFTPHDCRRLLAVYLKIRGKTPVEIADILGHEDLSSQLPYTLTEDPKHLDDLEQMVRKGLWTNITIEPGEDGIPMNAVFSKMQNYLTTQDDYDRVINLIEGIFLDADQMDLLPDDDNNEIISGFPIASHNCKAHIKLNCGHTELHCFGCDDYHPDEDKLLEHKAEIFRYLVMQKRDSYYAKGTNNVTRQYITIRTGEVENLLKEAYVNLSRKFRMSPIEMQNLQRDLSKKANQFWKTYSTTVPEPTFYQSLKYLQEGGL